MEGGGWRVESGGWSAGFRSYRYGMDGDGDGDGILRLMGDGVLVDSEYGTSMARVEYRR